MKERNIVLVFLFSIITNGIYFLYWLCILTEEIKAFNNDGKINSKSLACKLFLSILYFLIIVLLIYSLNYNNFNIILRIFIYISSVFGLYLILRTLWKISVELQQIQITNNISGQINPVLSVMLFFVLYIGVIYLQNQINETVKNISKKSVLE